MNHAACSPRHVIDALQQHTRKYHSWEYSWQASRVLLLTCQRLKHVLVSWPKV